jgi:TPR repeat protein
MAMSAPWSIKGVDFKAREAAKIMARRSGLTLGEWLNRAILDEAAKPAGAAADMGLSPQRAIDPAVHALGQQMIALASALDGRISAAETEIRALNARAAEDHVHTALAMDGVIERLTETEARIAGLLEQARAAQPSARYVSPFDALAAEALAEGPPAQDLFDETRPPAAAHAQAATTVGPQPSGLVDDDADFIPIPLGAQTAPRRVTPRHDLRPALIVAGAALALGLAGAGVLLSRPERPPAVAAKPAPPRPAVDPAIAQLQGGAAAGDTAAMHRLALAYFNGDGVEKDLPKAAQWFRAAAEKGVVPAQHNLALMYAAGSGAARDPVEACAWFSVAATGGDAEADKALRDIWKGLTPDQRRAANARVATLRGALKI